MLSNDPLENVKSKFNNEIKKEAVFVLFSKKYFFESLSEIIY